jgi:Protein of unknown function (DUF1592)/Protein of unknown function (DUF1588)/Protein of unknown function (DUF1595)/Protein of unknown function (DUF1585)
MTALERRFARVPGQLRLVVLQKVLWVALGCGACTGGTVVEQVQPGTDDPQFNPDNPDPNLDPGNPGTLPDDPTSENWQPTKPCNPVLPRRVTRLSDRHIANALKSLFGLSVRPDFKTASGTLEDFLPNKAAALGGAVATKLKTTVEKLALEATTTGGRFVSCAGDEKECARKFIDDFAAQAFRHPIMADERDQLLRVYDRTKTELGTHTQGIRYVMEAVLQSPSFVYQTELGAVSDTGRFVLSAHELAAKISFYLTDTLPDPVLRMAAASGVLDNDAGIRAEVQRLIALPETRTNIENMFRRLFRTERIFDINKAPEVTAFTLPLKTALQEETNRFIADVLWKRDATLTSLLTSRSTFVNPLLAAHYGVPHPGGEVFVAAELPADRRSGILTRGGLMATEALPAESSVVHRGVFTVREMMCFFPPPPDSDALAAAEALFKGTNTERERAIKRANVSRCAGCHAFFDPYGINYEHYDTLGKYRDTIETPAGPVAVDAAWDGDLYDVRGPIANAVALSERLSQSAAVRECMARQFGSYALGQHLDDEQACTVSAFGKQLAADGGNLLDLVANVATWPGLRYRKDGEAQ